MDYKFCPNCGKEVQPNSNACTECGTILNEKAVKEINASKIPNGININIDKNKIKDNVNSFYNNVKNIDTDKIKQNVGNVYNNAVDVAKSKKKVALIAGVVAVVTVIAIVLIAILGSNGGNSKKEQLAIQTAENYYSERMGDQYNNLVMESTIAKSDNLGVVYIVDVSIKSHMKAYENDNTPTEEDSEHGILIPIIFNEDGTCTIAPDTNLLDNAYYYEEEHQNKLSQLEFTWITTV
ncbi:MAG: zinc ribbon domain-containing protein [Eubacterium sp.]|nr:zinc ribbon domain-containing protein [Eubacterium sp.]